MYTPPAIRRSSRLTAVVLLAATLATGGVAIHLADASSVSTTSATSSSGSADSSSTGSFGSTSPFTATSGVAHTSTSGS